MDLYAFVTPLLNITTLTTQIHVEGTNTEGGDCVQTKKGYI